VSVYVSHSRTQGWVSSRKKGISSLPMGRNGFLPGRKPFFQEGMVEIGKKTPKGHRVCDNNQLIW